MKLYFVLAVVALHVTGCASRPEETFVLNPAVVQDGAARIVVYRPETSFHRANAELPFVYVDGTRAGKLGIGSAVNIVVPPGDHTVAIKESVLFMPGYESKSATLKAEAGATYYVRYAKEWSGGGVVVPKGPAALFTETTLEVVAAETGTARR